MYLRRSIVAKYPTMGNKHIKRRFHSMFFISAIVWRGKELLEFSGSPSGNLCCWYFLLHQEARNIQDFVQRLGSGSIGSATFWIPGSDQLKYVDPRIRIRLSKILSKTKIWTVKPRDFFKFPYIWMVNPFFSLRKRIKIKCIMH